MSALGGSFNLGGDLEVGRLGFGAMRITGPGIWGEPGDPSAARQLLRRVVEAGVNLIDTADSYGPELQEEGKIQHIGVSNVDVEQLERARGIAPIVSVQNRYNLIDRSGEEVLEECEREGLGFLSWFPLATGEFAKPGGSLDAIASAHDATAAQVALAWLLQRSPVTLPIPGTGSIAHFEENVEAAELELSPEEWSSLAG